MNLKKNHDPDAIVRYDLAAGVFLRLNGLLLDGGEKMHKFTLKICLSILSILFFFFSSPGFAFSISDFLPEYYQNSETYQVNQQRLDLAKSRYQKNSDQNFIEVSLSPFAKQSKYTLVTEYPTEVQKSLLGSLTQQTGVGLQWGLQWTKDLGSEDLLSSSYIENGLSIFINQSLLKNSFGKASLSELNKVKEELRQDQLVFLQNQYQVCQSGLELYIDTYTLQQKNIVLKESLETSKRAFNIAKNHFSKRLINKLNFLSAKNDSFKSEELQLNSQSEFDQKLKKVFQSTGSLKDIVFDSPKSLFQGIEIKELPVAQGFSSQIESIGVEIARQNYAQVKSENKDTLDLKIEVGDEKGKYFSSPNLYSYQDQFAKVSLTWKTDFFKSREESVKQSLLAKNIALLKKKMSEEDISVQQHQDLLALEELKNRISLSDKRLLSLKEQSDEALRILRVGQLEFIDYLRYRDEYQNEYIKNLDLYSRYWKKL
ncbi:MAG: TolC family protein, partial [Bdellovibrionales bacterium]|nr:TolC family protein [Bdellovibrionales bacterium]